MNLRQAGWGAAAERVAFAGLLVVLAVISLPFGADRPWAGALFSIAIGLLLVGWGVGAVFSAPLQRNSVRPILPSLVLFVLVVGWAAMQSVAPIPSGWRHPLWSESELALGRTLSAGVSFDRHETRTSLMHLMAYAGTFILTYQLCQVACCAERLARFIVGVTPVYASYGLIVEATGLNKVLWYDKTGDIGHLSSTFLNRNHFATYVGLGLMCAVGLLFRPVLRSGDLDSGRRVAVRVFLEYFVGRTWLLVFIGCVLFSTILMTHSRAGLVVTLLGLATISIVGIWIHYGRATVRRGTTAIWIIGIVIFAVSGRDTLRRFDHASLAIDERRAVYARTAGAIALTPVLGVGLGTFGKVFPMHRGDAIRPPFHRAHNTYLENTLELGVPAAVALIGAIGWITIICGRAVVRHRRRAIVPGIGVAASALVGAHALVDYSLQIPAVATTYAAILGAACGRSVHLQRSRAPDLANHQTPASK